MLVRREEIYKVSKNLGYCAVRSSSTAMCLSLHDVHVKNLWEKKSFYFQFGPNCIFYSSQICCCKDKLGKMHLCAAFKGVTDYNPSCDFFHQN